MQQLAQRVVVSLRDSHQTDTQPKVHESSTLSNHLGGLGSLGNGRHKVTLSHSFKVVGQALSEKEGTPAPRSPNDSVNNNEESKSCTSEAQAKKKTSTTSKHPLSQQTS